jgi:hypothetical protein
VTPSTTRRRSRFHGGQRQQQVTGVAAGIGPADGAEQACAAGLVATLFTGRAPAQGAEPRALRPEEPEQPPKAA